MYLKSLELACLPQLIIRGAWLESWNCFKLLGFGRYHQTNKFIFHFTRSIKSEPDKERATVSIWSLLQKATPYTLNNEFAILYIAIFLIDINIDVLWIIFWRFISCHELRLTCRLNLPPYPSQDKQQATPPDYRERYPSDKSVNLIFSD